MCTDKNNESDLIDITPHQPNCVSVSPEDFDKAAKWEIKISDHKGHGDQIMKVTNGEKRTTSKRGLSTQDFDFKLRPCKESGYCLCFRYCVNKCHKQTFEWAK